MQHDKCKKSTYHNYIFYNLQYFNKNKTCMDFRKKSHVYNNNNKFLYIINENKMILINTNLSDETQIKKRFETLSFTIISFDHFQTFLLSPFCKTSFIQSQNPFKKRVSPDLQQKHKETHLSLKKTAEREKERTLLLPVSRDYRTRCTRLAPLVSLFSFGVSIQGGARVSRLLFR